ncbi:MAG: ATP-binding cassette domain-containing protein [Actinobacteria bacterium]|nr:ATP-binding cassette domain-containing protein [Actinomycetota bacterium]
MNAAIEAEGLVKTYPGGVRALDGVGFRVAAGTIFGLLGPNGAGKSTTVKILTTLSRADAGTARVAGLDVGREPVAVRRAIGVVGQKNAVDGEATGRENLLLQGRLYGLRGRALSARVDDLLERFRLADAADRFAKGYSGGMQRRLDVALGLVARPQVLFLDEPTTGLDPEVRVAMWEEISTLAREEGLTILLTTHYLEEADQLASQLAIVDRGRIVAEGSPEQLKAELRGDRITIELDGDGVASVHEALARVGGVREVALDGRLLHARADQGARAVPAVLAALESEGVSVAAVTVARASLDDVYLRHTGRTFESADAGHAAPDGDGAAASAGEAGAAGETTASGSR